MSGLDFQILERIDRKLDAVLEKVSEHGERIAVLEEKAADSNQHRQGLAGVVGGLIGGIAGAAGDWFLRR